jgi:hypothetical protein
VNATLDLDHYVFSYILIDIVKIFSVCLQEHLLASKAHNGGHLGEQMDLSDQIFRMVHQRIL